MRAPVLVILLAALLQPAHAFSTVADQEACAESARRWNVDGLVHEIHRGMGEYRVVVNEEQWVNLSPIFQSETLALIDCWLSPDGFRLRNYFIVISAETGERLAFGQARDLIHLPSSPPGSTDE